MTDRELLEKAAKAAGHRFIEWTSDVDGVDVAIIVRADGDGFSKSVWQPLLINQMTDCMGDAIRLAVKLSIGGTWHAPLGYATAVHCPSTSDPIIWIEEYGVDPYAATRRVIVRAAAALAQGVAA